MVLNYAKIVRFSTSPTYGNMFEARLTKDVLAWVGEAQELLTNGISFNVEYIYNEIGVACDANICVQIDGVTIGCFSPQLPKLSEILGAYVPPTPPQTNHPDSDPIHYYALGYYAPGYYV